MAGVIIMREIRPQPGPQEKFLQSPADIVIYGGAAGGGKTYALLLECLRHMGNKDFGAVIFRRQLVQIIVQGGLLDNAVSLYSPLHVKVYRSLPPHILFPSGACLDFRYIRSDGDVYGYQGAQIPLICYDELTHFSEFQFFYMLSRNRSTCGVKPYIRATCNPDSDSWVAEFISWWIDQDTGYAIPERSGVVRYMCRRDNELIWGDSPEELAAKYEIEPTLCKSVTFISSSIYDNQILLKANPEYLANLNGLDMVEKERLLNGNWKIRPAAGLYFKRDAVRIVDTVPDKIAAIARSWDLAATEITNENKNPDRTAGVLMARLKNGMFIVLDVVRAAANAADVRRIIKGTAAQDAVQYQCYTITIPQDPGQAGKEQAASYIKELAGYSVSTAPVSGNKEVRANPFSAQWQGHNVLLLKGEWNKAYLDEMDGFPDTLHDDMVDASSDAFKTVAITKSWKALAT